MRTTIKGWANKTSLEKNIQSIIVYLDKSVDSRFIPVTITYSLSATKEI